VKALSLHQPWADAIALGKKSWETRSWKTNYRGVLAIHATKAKINAPVEVLVAAYGYRARLWEGGSSSGIVALVNLVDCKPAEQVRDFLRAGLASAPSFELRDSCGRNLHLGYFTPGRWAWTLELVCKIEPAIHCKGHQQIWNLPPEIASRITAICTQKGISL
jgi:hypothetical protein